MSALLLLHGALGSAALFDPLKEILAPHYPVYTFDFRGHGGKALDEKGLSIDALASDLYDFLKAKDLTNIAVFGYSMGGYVALSLLKKHPHIFSKVITLATRFSWNPEIAARECAMLNPDKIEAKLPLFAQTLEARHAPHSWKDLMDATAAMLHDLGAAPSLSSEDYPNLDVPFLLMLGDRDKMVSLEETTAVYKAIPHAALAVLPNTPHALEQADPSLIAFFIHRFLGS